MFIVSFICHLLNIFTPKTLIGENDKGKCFYKINFLTAGALSFARLKKDSPHQNSFAVKNYPRVTLVLCSSN